MNHKLTIINNSDIKKIFIRVVYTDNTIQESQSVRAKTKDDFPLTGGKKIDRILLDGYESKNFGTPTSAGSSNDYSRIENNGTDSISVVAQEFGSH
ncbi:MAG: hypothetical protein ABI840_03390 [bacterium]